jgi:hypothetical protein
MIAEIKIQNLEERFDRIEALFISLESKLLGKKPINSKDLEVIPICEIAGKGKLMSMPTLYKHVKEGKIELLKLGNRSYVSKTQFYGAFSNGFKNDYSERFKKNLAKDIG